LAERSGSRRSRATKLIVALVVLAALFVLGRTVDVESYLAPLRDQVQAFGAWSWLVYIGIYTVATLLTLPGTPFTVLAALLFGPIKGFVIMTVATTVSATAGFFIARYFARAEVERRLGHLRIFHRLRSMTENDHWLVIPFIRIAPFFPYALNNYALGLTNLSFWRYILWSELIFVPMNALLVWGAQSIYRAAVEGEVSWPLIGATTGVAVLVLLLGVAAKRAVGGRADGAAVDEQGGR
jgi:uncharacterized membrane protein YdjX (TVP38/TMEM64 family)